jgi:hypothetical protein
MSVNICKKPIQEFIDKNPQITLENSIDEFYKCLNYSLIQQFLGIILSFIVNNNTIKINYTGIPDNENDAEGFVYKMITNESDSTLKLLIRALNFAGYILPNTSNFVINLLTYIVSNLQMRLKNGNNRNRLNMYYCDKLQYCSSILSTVIDYLINYQRKHYDFYIQKVFSNVRNIELKGHQFSKQQIICLLNGIIDTIDTNVAGFNGFTVTVGFCDDSTDSPETEARLQTMISIAKGKRIILQLVKDSDCTYIPPTVQQMSPGSTNLLSDGTQIRRPSIPNQPSPFYTQSSDETTMMQRRHSPIPIQPSPSSPFGPFGGKRTRRKQKQRQTKRTMRRFRRKRRSVT